MTLIELLSIASEFIGKFLASSLTFDYDAWLRLREAKSRSSESNYRWINSQPDRSRVRGWVQIKSVITTVGTVVWNFMRGWMGTSRITNEYRSAAVENRFNHSWTVEPAAIRNHIQYGHGDYEKDKVYQQTFPYHEAFRAENLPKGSRWVMTTWEAWTAIYFAYKKLTRGRLQCLRQCLLNFVPRYISVSQKLSSVCRKFEKYSKFSGNFVFTSVLFNILGMLPF